MKGLEILAYVFCLKSTSGSNSRGFVMVMVISQRKAIPLPNVSALFFKPSHNTLFSYALIWSTMFTEPLLYSRFCVQPCKYNVV